MHVSCGTLAYVAPEAPPESWSCVSQVAGILQAFVSATFLTVVTQLWDGDQAQSDRANAFSLASGLEEGLYKPVRHLELGCCSLSTAEMAVW